MTAAATGRLEATEALMAVQDAVAVVLGADRSTLSRPARLVEDLGADSLALVEIAEILEERLAPRARPGFAIDDDDLASMGSLGEFADYLAARA